MTDLPAQSQVPGHRIVRADLAGTAIFAAVVAVAVPWRESRPAQVAVIAVSMGLFALGVVVALVAYARAVERSRHDEVGVANLYLLTGPVAPTRVKRAMHLALGAQVIVALAGATVGVVGLDQGELNALAFGVLVPMYGIGLNGLWAARHGTYGQRTHRHMAPSNKRIG